MKQYAKAHVLSRFTAYHPTEATWHLEAWTRQPKRTAPVTRYYTAVIVDAAGNALERIEVTALTYTALRRIGHETPTQAALAHTPGGPAQVLDVKHRAHVVLQEAIRLQDRL